MKILVVEDDQTIAKVLQLLLSSYNYAVDIAVDGEAGLEMAEAFDYDLLLLDILLPRLDGIILCQQLRAKGFKTPILLLTGQGGTHQKAIALNAGADDYVVKPFDAEELIARVQALLRRGGPSTQPILTWGDLSLDPSCCKVNYGTHVLILTPKEFAILELLLRNTRRVLSVSVILDQVWNSVASPTGDVIRVHIKELRRKLKPVGAPKDLIKTVYGKGYQLNPLYSSVLSSQDDVPLTAPQIAELKSVNAELRATLAELQLAHTELSRKNEALAIAHEIIESELQQRQRAEQQLQVSHQAREQQVLEPTDHLIPANLHLQQQEQIYKALVENSPDIIERFDPQLRHLYVSPALATLTGVPAEQFLGKTCRELELPEAMVTLWEAAAQSLLTTGQVQSIEFKVPTSDGLKYFEMQLVPELAQAKTIESILCISRNVTRLKQVEFELRERNHALSYAAEGISQLDEKGRYRFVNAAYAHMVGYEPEEMIGMDWQRTVHPNDLESTIAKYQQMLSKGEVELEARGVRKDGSVFYKQLFMVATYDDQQQFTGHHCFMKDVSHRKQAETAIHLSQERLQLAIEGSGDGLWDWNMVTDEVYFSPQWLAMLGYNFGDLPNHVSTWERVIHPEDWPWVMDRLNTHLNDRACPYQFDYRVQTKSGAWKWIGNYGKVVVWDPQGKPLRMAGLHKDISDRKQAEVALKESEERFRYLADHAPVLIWISGCDKLCFHFNKQWLDFTGRTMEQELGNGWAEGVHPDDLQFCLDTYTHAFDTRQGFEMEYRFRRYDDEYRWILDVGIPRFDANEEFMGYIGSCIDISDRKQAEANLIRQAKIFESITDGVILTDLEGYIIDWNPAAEKLFGYTKTEVLGQTLGLLLQLEECAILTRQIFDGMTQNGHWSSEISFIRKDGSSGICETVFVPLLDQHGQLVASIGLNHDITQRKQTEQKIYEQAALLDIATEAILVRGLDHQILFWNKGAERLYGMTEKEVLGRNANELLYQDDWSGIDRIQSVLLDVGEWQGELPQVTKAGQKILVASRWTLVRDDNGRPQSILTVNTDITAKKELESQFLRAQRLESIGTLASGIAHDLNNVLTPILAISQLLRLTQTDQNTQTQEQLSLLEHSAKRGADMVKQILTFARGSDGEQTSVTSVRVKQREVKPIPIEVQAS